MKKVLNQIWQVKSMHLLKIPSLKNANRGEENLQDHYLQCKVKSRILKQVPKKSSD